MWPASDGIMRIKPAEPQSTFVGGLKSTEKTHLVFWVFGPARIRTWVSGFKVRCDNQLHHRTGRNSLLSCRYRVMIVDFSHYREKKSPVGIEPTTNGVEIRYATTAPRRQNVDDQKETECRRPKETECRRPIKKCEEWGSNPRRYLYRNLSPAP